MHKFEQLTDFSLTRQLQTMEIKIRHGSPIMVDYIGIESIQKIVRQRGAAAFIEGLAGEIEQDYRRWNDFDKSARHAIHSPDGVIELMPTSDGHQYSFKYCLLYTSDAADE